jgi:hypothetical protein
VQRIAQAEHDVVRDVDHVGDRTHAGGEQPPLEPGRRGCHPNVAERASDVARAAVEVRDLHVDGLLLGAWRIGPRRRRKLLAEECCNLARDAVDREQVGTVVAGLQLEHVLGELEDVGERRSRLGAVLEHEDAAVVDAELELALREDHSVRRLAAELRLLELLAVGKHRAGQCDGDRCPRTEVPRAADDLPRLGVAHVDAAKLQAICVWMLPRLDDLADEVVAEVAVGVGDAAPHDPVDFTTRDHEPPGDLLDRLVERDVFLQPAGGDAHGHGLVALPAA